METEPKKLSSLTGLQRRLEHARQRLADLQSCRADEKVTELESELSAYSAALAQIDGVEPFVARIDASTAPVFGKPPMGVSHLDTLRGSVSARGQTVREQLGQRTQVVSTREMFRAAVPQLEVEADARRAQIKRLAGGLLSGFTRVGSRDIDRGQDLPLVIDLMRLDGGERTEALRTSVYKRIGERREQAQADVAKWVDQNEVGHFTLHEIRYSFAPAGGSGRQPEGRHTAAVLGRVIEHVTPIGGADGTKQVWAVDEHAWLLQLPFSPDTVRDLLRGRAVEQHVNLPTQMVFIDAGTERVMDVSVVRSLGQSETGAIVE